MKITALILGLLTASCATTHKKSTSLQLTPSKCYYVQPNPGSVFIFKVKSQVTPDIYNYHVLAFTGQGVQQFTEQDGLLPLFIREIAIEDVGCNLYNSLIARTTAGK